jgi:hypothetical protein
MKRIILFWLFFISFGHSQVTSSDVTVKSTLETLPGASSWGSFTIQLEQNITLQQTLQWGVCVQGLRPGGPYTVKVTYVDKNKEITEINAPLGSNLTVNVVIEEESNTLKEVVGFRQNRMDFNKGKLVHRNNFLIES